MPLRRKDDDIKESKTLWQFLAYMANNHRVLFALTPSLALITLFLGIFLVMNIGYDARHGWRVIPRINVDIDVKKELKK
jgi:hypothetical protein